MVISYKRCPVKKVYQMAYKRTIYMNVHGIDGYITISKLLSIDIWSTKKWKKKHWTYGLLYPIGEVTQNILLKKRWIPSYLHIKLEKGSLNILSIRTMSYPYLIYILFNIYYIDKILALLIDRNFVRNLYQ